MTLIRQENVIESIAQALQFISYYHPQDFIQALNDAYLREESPAAKDAMAQILINSRMCAEGKTVVMIDYFGNDARVMLRLGQAWRVETTDELLHQLKLWLGKDAIRLMY